MTESRGVSEVTLHLVCERQPTLTRASLTKAPMEVRDFAHEVSVDEDLLARTATRWAEYSPGITAEVVEDEPNEAILTTLEEDCARQLTVRRFRRLEERLVPVAEMLTTEEGMSVGLQEPEEIPWLDPVTFVDAWSVLAVAEYQESRREWVWCVAAEQRRIHRDADATQRERTSAEGWANEGIRCQAEEALLERFDRKERRGS